MARTIFKAKTSKVNRPAPSASSSDASAYCRDLDTWPRSWMGWEKDLPPGEQLVACFRPFLEHLVASGLSRITTQKNVHNIWAPGRGDHWKILLRLRFQSAPAAKLPISGNNARRRTIRD